MRARWVADTTATYVRLRRRLRISPTDLVLDVGSGGNPNPRANVLCDKFVVDAAERHGSTLVVDRPFVVGDIQQLPFADNAFDFVICSHVLEHVPDPAAAISELQRVGRRGYIETPSAEWERLVGFPFHRWMVSNVNGRLRFEQKRAPVEDESLRRWFAQFQRRLRIERRAWFARHRIGVFTWLLWEQEIQFEVLRNAPDEDPRFVAADLAATRDESQAFEAGIASRLIGWLGSRSRAKSELSAEDFESLLRCPVCRGTVSRHARRCVCQRCARSYEIDAEGRPWLIA
jgi:SAM-dependent methyltransferase